MFSSKLNSKQNKGFTLMELLVVVAIIGLLAALIMTAVVTPRKKSRDAKGESEIRAIQRALWLKYSDLGHYPAELPSGLQNIDPNYTGLDPYLSIVPTDNGYSPYQWYRSEDQQQFCVLFKYETKPNSYFACSEIDCRIVSTPECQRPSE